MGTRTLWSYEVELTAELASASRSRGFVRRHLSVHGLAHLSDSVELVVSELATNAVLHAGTRFTVSLHAFEDTLLLEVEDGSWTGPCQAVFAEPGAVSGRGLSIVNLLSRDWGVDTQAGGGKSVWAEFELP
ncbi:ATP-binding protein [Nocardioides panacis]|uniref:ATP-binding protein n=1 Tax=Nocardioides panacis TaxID=2849501 RepID=UPI0020B37035|nr:ATP-binding protein [Nocardioides panacis]